MTSDEDLIPAAIAAVASGSLLQVANADDANRIFSSIIENVAKDCVKAGSWMIGHIKANVRSGGELLSVSSTTDDGNVRYRYSFKKDVKDYSMTVNVIVYGIERHTAAEILISNMRKALDNVDIQVRSETGCEDPECGDPMCRDEGHRRIIAIE